MLFSSELNMRVFVLKGIEDSNSIIMAPEMNLYRLFFSLKVVFVQEWFQCPQDQVWLIFMLDLERNGKLKGQVRTFYFTFGNLCDVLT